MMLLSRGYLSFVLAALGFGVFSCFVAMKSQVAVVTVPESVGGRVVVSAPALVALYGGDRFLAANIETVRLATTSIDPNDVVDTDYLARAQFVVSELNACHEDNYYLANGLLTWGGLVSEGNEVLRRAMICRFWDGVPSFFYGVNRSFFDRDVDEAVHAFELSAARWPENAASFRRMAIMLRAESFNDASLALEYLQQQHATTRDSRLQGLLELRIIRLQGLIDLRVAQSRYEFRHGALSDLSQLVEGGELSALPEDPLGLGYELRNGRIELRKLRIAGMENQP